MFATFQHLSFVLRENRSLNICAANVFVSDRTWSNLLWPTSPAVESSPEIELKLWFTVLLKLYEIRDCAPPP